MTITHRNTTGAAGGTTTGLSFTMPTGHALDDLLIAWAGGKPYNLSISAGTILTDYTDRGSKTSGTTANGVGVGSCWVHARTRTHDGSETVPSATLSATPSPRLSGMSAFSKTNPGPWDIQSTGGADVSASGTALSITSDSAIDLKPGDVLVICIVAPDDTALPVSGALSAAGINFSGGIAAFTTQGTTSGNDAAIYLVAVTVTSGTATVNVTYTDTLANSGESEAAAIFLRLREPAAVHADDYWGAAA